MIVSGSHRIKACIMVLVITASVSTCVLSSTAITELTGLFCASFNSPFSQKDNCVCMQIKDETKLLSHSYNKGKLIRNNEYAYKIEGGRLIIDTQGEAGMDEIVFKINSKNKFSTKLAIEKSMRASEFKKTKNVPSNCL